MAQQPSMPCCQDSARIKVLPHLLLLYPGPIMPGLIMCFFNYSLEAPQFNGQRLYNDKLPYGLNRLCYILLQSEMRQGRLTIKLLTPSLWGLSSNTDPASLTRGLLGYSHCLHDMPCYRLEKENHYDHLHIYLPQTSEKFNIHSRLLQQKIKFVCFRLLILSGNCLKKQ